MKWMNGWNETKDEKFFVFVSLFRYNFSSKLVFKIKKITKRVKDFSEKNDIKLTQRLYDSPELSTG